MEHLEQFIKTTQAAIEAGRISVLPEPKHIIRQRHETRQWIRTLISQLKFLDQACEMPSFNVQDPALFGCRILAQAFFTSFSQLRLSQSSFDYVCYGSQPRLVPKR